MSRTIEDKQLVERSLFELREDQISLFTAYKLESRQLTNHTFIRNFPFKWHIEEMKKYLYLQFFSFQVYQSIPFLKEVKVCSC